MNARPNRIKSVNTAINKKIWNGIDDHKSALKYRLRTHLAQQTKMFFFCRRLTIQRPIKVHGGPPIHSDRLFKWGITPYGVASNINRNLMFQKRFRNNNLDYLA